MNADTVGIVLLAPAFFETKPADVLAKARADIHAQLVVPMSAINLQTMSYIRS